MNIITVIPLSRSKVAPELSYFTSAEVPVGAIVAVPLRSKTINGIVTSCRPGEEIKGDIKRASFTIRKLDKVSAKEFFPLSFISACKSLSEYYATPIGTVIDTMVADVIMDNAGKIKPPAPAHIEDRDSAAKTKTETKKIESRVLAVQGDDDDRLSAWRSLIRQEFARKKSIVVHVPTIEDCEKFYTALEKGIEGYIFKLNSGESPKTILAIWKKIHETSHPIVIVATGSFCLLPRADIETVVIERESGRGWMAQKNPYLDIRQALEAIALANGQTVYIADILLRTETLYRLEQNAIDEGSPFKWRSISTAKDSLVNMVTKPASKGSAENGRNGGANTGMAPGQTSKIELNDKAKPGFRTVSPELKSLIALNRDESTHLFIMTIRRGLATMTVCDDCGTIVSCRNCSSPVVLHTSAETGKNFFMCHVCGERRSATETCVNCTGWRLTPLGIGIDRVAEEIQGMFPDIDIFKIDADTAKSEKRISEIMAKFRAHPGGILLGTELALNHIGDHVDHVAVASLDSLLALPDFRIQEKIMYTLTRLRSLASRSFLVQSRRPTEKVFDYALKGNLSDFYRTSVEDRQQFSYPPFFVLVKITIEGVKEAIAKQMSEISKMVAPREIDIFPAFTSTSRGKSVIHGLMKIASHAWPDQDLAAKLRELPAGVSVKINPESLL